jgi:hypothetical protein
METSPKKDDIFQADTQMRAAPTIPADIPSDGGGGGGGSSGGNGFGQLYSSAASRATPPTPMPAGSEEAAMVDPCKETTEGKPLCFGHFRVVKLLGRGGMGDVYLARDTRLDRLVAVKTLRPEVAALHPNVTQRFLQEARSAAKLTHSNVVQIYFSGVEGETPYFAMELVQGRSLRETLEEDGPFPVDKALDCALQAAKGLRAAAENGIAHRDIKPANLMIDAEGTVKIADFGLAKNLESSLELTQSGALVGTPYYMSPEQSEGDDVSFRSDIYSLGATLYHLLAGRPPFQADTPARLMLKHITEPLPRTPEMVKMLGGAVFSLLEKMMAKNAAARHASYDELISELEGLLRLSRMEESSCVELVAARRQLSALKMALGAAAVGLLGIGALVGALWNTALAKRLTGSAPSAAISPAASAASLAEAGSNSAGLKLDYNNIPLAFRSKPDVIITADKVPASIKRNEATFHEFHRLLIHYEFRELIAICEKSGPSDPEKLVASQALNAAQTQMREQMRRLSAKLDLSETIAVQAEGQAWQLVSLGNEDTLVFRPLSIDARKAEAASFEIKWSDLAPAVAMDLFRQSADKISERSRLFLIFWALSFQIEPLSDERADFDRYAQDFATLLKAMREAENNLIEQSEQAALAVSAATTEAAVVEMAPGASGAGVASGFVAKPASVSLLKLLPQELAEKPEWRGQFLGALLGYDHGEASKLLLDVSGALPEAAGATLASAQPILGLEVRERLEKLQSAALTFAGGGGGERVEVVVDGKRYALLDVRGLNEPREPVWLDFQSADDPEAVPFEIAWRDLSPAVALDLFRRVASLSDRSDQLFLAYWAAMFDLSLTDAEIAAGLRKPVSLEEWSAQLSDIMDANRPPAPKK